MTDELNVVTRIRENIRKEKSRLESIHMGSGYKFNDEYTKGKIDILSWVEVSLNLEIENLRSYLITNKKEKKHNE